MSAELSLKRWRRSGKGGGWGRSFERNCKQRGQNGPPQRDKKQPDMDRALREVSLVHAICRASEIRWWVVGLGRWLEERV